ncbi:UNVERIFIED_CONTAM: hypothetical protein Slati_1374800, partial [Sesamum latifolium]
MQFHRTSHRLCPMLQEETIQDANTVGGLFGPPSDPYSNMYNLGWMDYSNIDYIPNLKSSYHLNPTPNQQFQQSTHTSIQNLESQVSQLASCISRLESQVEIEQDVGILQARTDEPKTTDREHHKVLMTKPPFQERFAKKEEGEKKEKLKTVNKVVVNIPLIDAIKRIPHYAKFLKALCTNKCKLKDFVDPLVQEKA